MIPPPPPSFCPALPLLAELNLLRDMLPVVGITLVTVSMMMMYLKRRKRIATDPRLTPQEQVERNRQARGMAGDLEELMVEIEQLAKRLGAQLDARTVQMEQLLRQADRRIAELKALQNGDASIRPEPSTERFPGGVGRPPIPAPAVPEPDDPLARSIYDLADQGHDPVAIARQLQEHVGKVELILALRDVR